MTAEQHEKVIHVNGIVITEDYLTKHWNKSESQQNNEDGLTENICRVSGISMSSILFSILCTSVRYECNHVLYITVTGAQHKQSNHAVICV